MVANRREDALRRLELVETDELAPDDAVRPDPSYGRRATPGERHLPVEPSAGGGPPSARRRVVTAVVAVAVVAAVFVASSLWQSRAGRLALLDAHGGVASLATPPVGQWTTSTTGLDVWALGDAVVVVKSDTVVGLDPSDGEARWSADLGGPPRCGPSPEDLSSAPLDALVCLTGPEDDPRAWVLSADGTVASRTDLGDGLGRAIAVPDGHVVRWQRTGGVLEVAVQDATDASVRWRSTVAPDDLARTDLCRPQVSAYATARVEHGLIVLRGCRLSAVFTLDGARVDDRGEPVTSQVLGSRAGTFLRTTSGSATGAVQITELVRTDGTVERIVPGRPLVPLASDGTADPTRLLLVPSGVQAVDLSGNERWTLSGTVSQVVAVADGTAALDLGYVVLGVDLASGREVWSWERESLGTTDQIVGAFTDGVVAALVITSLDGSGGARVVALDLELGDVVWDEEYPLGAAGFRAVGGRLVHLDPALGQLVVHE